MQNSLKNTFRRGFEADEPRTSGFFKLQKIRTEEKSFLIEFCNLQVQSNFGFPEEEANDNKCRKWRYIFRNIEAKTVQYHNNAKY